MRLPDKKEIEKGKILERQVEIKEGLRLAKKVDDVRLELITEQNNLNKFKTETVKLVQKEIDDLLSKKESLSRENQILEQHNQNLKVPFDEEWESIRKVRLSELDYEYEKIQDNRVIIDQEKSYLTEKISEIDKEKEEIQLTHKQADELFSEAKDKEERANALVQQAKIHQAEVQSVLDAEKNQLDKKAEEVALKIRDIEIRELALKKSIEALVKRERFINSKYKVLMQTQNALKQDVKSNSRGKKTI